MPFKITCSYPPVRACLSRYHLVLVFDTGLSIYALGELPTSVAKDRKDAEFISKEFTGFQSFPRNPSSNRYETAPNPQGLCCLGTNKIVFPGRTKGQVMVVDLVNKKTNIIPAHDSALQSLAISSDEQLLATASRTGTLIRIWSIDGARIAEFRRGVDRAIIFSLAFSPSALNLAATSDKSTLHIFDLPRGLQPGDSQSNDEAAVNVKSKNSTSSPINTPSKPSKRAHPATGNSPLGSSPSALAKHSPTGTPPTDYLLGRSPSKNSPLLSPTFDGPSDRLSITPSEAVSQRGAADPYWTEQLLRQQQRGGGRRTGSRSTLSASPDVATEGGDGAGVANPARKYGGLADLPYAPRFLRDSYSSLSCRFEIGDESAHVPRGALLQERYAEGRPPKGRIAWIDDDEIVVVGAGRDARWEKFRIGFDVEGRRGIERVGWKYYLDDDGLH